MHTVDNAAVLRTVLYVEDDDVNALLMQTLFERRPDLRLRVAPNAAEALRCAWAQQPALLLLDLRLPDSHGCTLLQQLRVLPGLQTVPAVAVTAEALHGLDLRGFDDLWPKPLRLLWVLNRLNHWLPHRQVRTQPPPGAACMAIGRAGLMAG